MLQVNFHQDALLEFHEAAAYYEFQRRDLGVEFIEEIERCITLAAEQPIIYPVVAKNLRRVAARRFPLTIYFRLESNRIIIIAVFHSSRDPKTWRRRD
ncbi:MAG: type II toxin-antitoxin system RelE/ParE family toxin [Abditibacteriaceae bacterium]